MAQTEEDKLNDAFMEQQQAALIQLANQVGRNVVAVIDAVARRGGFGGEELAAIGKLREQSVQMTQVVETIESNKGE